MVKTYAQIQNKKVVNIIVSEENQVANLEKALKQKLVCIEDLEIKPELDWYYIDEEFKKMEE